MQAKKRALLGQKDRLRLLKKMQSGKERVQRKMERGRNSDNGEHEGAQDDASKADVKPATREIRCDVLPRRAKLMTDARKENSNGYVGRSCPCDNYLPVALPLLLRALPPQAFSCPYH